MSGSSRKSPVVFRLFSRSSKDALARCCSPGADEIRAAQLTQQLDTPEVPLRGVKDEISRGQSPSFHLPLAPANHPMPLLPATLRKISGSRNVPSEHSQPSSSPVIGLFFSPIASPVFPRKTPGCPSPPKPLDGQPLSRSDSPHEAPLLAAPLEQTAPYLPLLSVGANKIRLHTNLRVRRVKERAKVAEEVLTLAIRVAPKWEANSC